MELHSSAAATATAGGSASSDVEKKKVLEGSEPKVKRKMKTASQLEILEKTYATETYPSEAVRAELSVKLGLSDRQLQMWFCHRRLKDRKATTPVKRQKTEASPVAMVSSGGGQGDEMAMSGEIGKEHASGSGSRISPIGLVDLQLLQHHQHHQQRVVHRPGTAVPRCRTEMPALKRYYEPPQSVSELRAIAFVEAQLGEPLKEDGPILGMEFDPLPPGAFGAPIVAATQHKPAGRPFEAHIYERPENSIKGTTRTLREYQFLPEQPSIRSDTYEQSVSSHHYSPIEVQSTRTMLSTVKSYTQGSEQVASGFSFPGQIPTLNLLPQQGRQGHVTPASAEADVVPLRSLVNVEVEANYGGLPMTALESLCIPSDTRVVHDEERLERKRKSEEARIAREVEAHEKRIRKELEKQDMLRRKREEQMRKDMERQDRERRKEEERLLREKQREEERYQREQRREMERREKFLQKESIRVEKMRLKEEMRQKKEVARLKAANVRATARRIAKESVELIEDEHMELMELAASKKGLPTISSLDSETLQNLEAFRDMLNEFPPKSVCLRKPFGVEPWICSEEAVGNLLMVWRFLITFSDVLRLWPFTLDEFVQSFHDYDPRLLGEIHIALLKLIIKDIEDIGRTPASVVGANPNSGGGHPEIVEGAYAWGFDIRSWQSHLNALTWPEILRQFALSAGFGPNLKKQSVEPAYPRDENEGNDGADIISNLRSGVAAENAIAKMQQRGFSTSRRSRHRLTPGTVKFAAFHVLSLEGSKGLNILEVAEKIQKSGLRDLTTSKTPEASISAALSRDTKLFERTAPSTYCVRDPYRKDPADADAILSGAREKIRAFKNECVNGEEAEDVEKEDAERDDESESDAADDPEVDDLVPELKFKETPQSHQTDRTDGMNSTVNASDVLRFDLTRTPEDLSLQKPTRIMHPEGFGELKPVGTSDDQTTAIDADASILYQEDTVIDESNTGQKWVQGLMEGEYSDLTVEERLDALAALIGVANEGNSIRLVLEERLEAASALKKQIWAEAQLDKRRFKEEFLLKVQYPSSSSNVEQLCSITPVETRQSPLLVVDGQNEVEAVPSLQQEVMHKLPDESNNSSDVALEKTCPMQETHGGQDNSQLQSFAYVAELSRSQLKAYIVHRAEETFVYRSLPLGQDRRRNRYWQFTTSPSRNDPGSGRIFVELRDGRWRLIDSEKDFNALMASLDVRGLREFHLHSMLQKIEATFKETARTHKCVEEKVENPVKEEASETAPSNDCSSNTGSPKSTICVSNCETPEPSNSFLIGLGRNKMETADALRRYSDLEKWMWEECVNSQLLCAKKYGRMRCKRLINICNNCHATYFLEDNHCPCCHRTLSSTNSTYFMEHVAQCKEKLEDLYGPLCILDSSPPLRVRLLRAQLASMEACIPPEALQPLWSEVYRRSWGLKLHIASAAGDLLQILTLLEGAIKREYLMSNYETTSEMLNAVSNSNLDSMGVLPWVPHTTSAVALRLMELDSSLCYTEQQKADSVKDKETTDFITLKTNYADMKSHSGVLSAEASRVYENLELDKHANSGRGRNSGRGARSRVGGGRSQRKVGASRSASARRSSTKNSDEFGHITAGKGRDRAKGRRKKGRRSVRNKQKPVKNVEIAAVEKVPVSRQQNWKEDKDRETAAAFEPPDNDSDSGTSGSGEDNGQATGDDYEDLMADDYDTFGGKTDHASNKIGYNVVQHYAEPNEDGDDVDDYDDQHDEGDEEDGLADENVQRYFDGESEEEGNRFMDEELVENQNKESESSEYSD